MDELELGLPYEKRRRARRVHLNRKHKKRDRYKLQDWRGAQLYAWFRHRHFEPDYTFNRRPTHTETGFGVAHERNPEARLY